MNSFRLDNKPNSIAMHFAKRSIPGRKTFRVLRLHQTSLQVAVVLGLTTLYILTFQTLFERTGPVVAALVTIPVAAAGSYFGVQAGVLSSFVGIILSAFLLSRFEGTFAGWLITGWAGNLMLIAAGVATGITRKKIVDQTRIEDELLFRERFLALVGMATKSILSVKSPREVFYHLIAHLVNLFVADWGNLIQWDSKRGQAFLVATTKPMEQVSSNALLEPKEAALIESVIQDGHIVFIEDVSSSPHIVSLSVFDKPSDTVRSALCIPLVAGDFKFGAVTIMFNAPRRFSRAEMIYAELASNQIALSLWTFEQDLKLRKRLKEASTLANIERTLSENQRVGLETVLQMIVDSAKELLPKAKQVVLHLLDESQETLIPRAVTGALDRPRSKLNMRIGEGIAGEVIATGQTIAISDTRTDPRFLEQSPTVTFRSLIVAPIQSNEQRVGTLSMQSNEAGVFDADDINLLGSLGTQAAIAIENARLLETTRQDLKEINALYHIMRRLVGSLDPEQLMRDVINLLKNEFGFNYVQIYLVDAEANELLFCDGTGRIGEEFKRQKRRLSLGAGIIGYVAETGRPFLTNDVGQVIFHVPNPLLPDVQAELAMPIKTEDQVLGVLDVQHLSRHFTDRHMQLISAVADQLALALEKANLYTTVQDSLRQEKTMRAQLIQNERLTIMGRLLASVSHELNNPLQAIQNALFLLKEEKGISWQGHQDLEIVLSETERMGMLIERLRNVYRPSRSANFQEVEINGLIEDVYTLVATHLRHSKITFEFHPDPQLPCVIGISDQLRQVVLNLFVNAVEAMPSGGRIIVSTQQLLDQERIMFSVKDTGSGVDPELLPHIFEPFITGKDSGTGLGLTITHDIILQHRGEITVENDPEGGALFRIWLPIRIEVAR